MKVLFVNEQGVRELLPMKDCVALMRDARAAIGAATFGSWSSAWLARYHDRSGTSRTDTRNPE